MPLLLLFVIFNTFALLYFIVKPVAEYVYDSKNLRKYSNQTLFSGITNLSNIWERILGFRTKRLYEQHKEYPILRIGQLRVIISHLSFSWLLQY